MIICGKLRWVTKTKSNSRMCSKHKTPPVHEELGARLLDIKIYPNIRPLMDSAFDAEAVHVRFCIFTGHNKGSELLVADLILPYLIAACLGISNGWIKNKRYPEFSGYRLFCLTPCLAATLCQ